MNEHLGYAVPERLQSMVDKGLLGRKSDQGFYHYHNRKIVRPTLPKQFVLSPDIIKRLIGRMQTEAEACMQEGIVADTDLLDAGMIFGAGFAPFRGGLMNYIQNEP